MFQDVDPHKTLPFIVCWKGLPVCRCGIPAVLTVLRFGLLVGHDVGHGGGHLVEHGHLLIQGTDGLLKGVDVDVLIGDNGDAGVLQLLDIVRLRGGDQVVVLLGALAELLGDDVLILLGTILF